MLPKLSFKKMEARKMSIKQFIRKLKSELKYGLCRIKEPELSLTLHAIDKLAGKELSNG